MVTVGTGAVKAGGLRLHRVVLGVLGSLLLSPSCGPGTAGATREGIRCRYTGYS